MATYSVTSSNYNDPKFWGSIIETGSGHTLDFSALPSDFTVYHAYGGNYLYIHDGDSWFTVGSGGIGGVDATLGGLTGLSSFTSYAGGAGADLYGGSEAGELIEGNAGDDIIDAAGGNDTVSGGAGNDLILTSSDGGQGGGTRIDWKAAGLVDRVQGSSGQDYFTWAAAEGSSTTLRLGQSRDSGEGDGEADYVVVETTNETGTLTLHNFDFGLDKIVLQEVPVAAKHYAGDGYYEVALAYENGNVQSFLIYSDDRGADLREAFTTDMPLELAGDLLMGGDDADTFLASNDFGNDTVIGGEGGRDFDVLDFSLVTDPVTLTYTGDESGTITDGTDTLSFSEIERVILSDRAETIDASATTGGIQIEAGGGADLLRGGSGDDTIYLGDGADTVAAGAGDDLIDDIEGGVTSGTQWIDAGLGDDTVLYGGGDDTVFGGEGNDRIDDASGEQHAGRNLIDGGAGSDTIWAGHDSDTLIGGLGADYLSGEHDDDLFILEDDFGADTILGGSGGTDSDTVDFSALTGAVTVTYSGNEAGAFSAGSDRASFSDIEAFTLTGFDDRIDATATTRGIRVAESAGNDVVLGGSGGDTIWGGEGSDYIDGGDGDDMLFTGTGEDTLIGGAGNDTLSNSSGDDSLVGGTGDDSITATEGDDTLEGGEGSDTMHGGADNDRLVGGRGADSMTGDGGSDTFIIEDGFGADTIEGGETGSDVDMIDLSALSGPVTVTYTGDEAGTITDGTDTLSFTGIERLRLTDHDDSVDASAQPTAGAWVEMGGGNDSFTADQSRDSAQQDTVFGGSGNDTISTGSGEDSIEGGSGDDSIDGGDRGDTIFGGAGNDRIEAGEEYAQGDSDLILGGDGNDTITSAETDAGSQDTIYGEAGADSISVTGGDRNFLDGGADNDTIVSGTGNDTLSGDAGDDLLTGGAGDDALSGGTGNDVFTYAAGDGSDTINDFNTGNTGGLEDGDSANNDFIDLSGYYDHISELYADQADDGVLNQSNAADSRGQAVDYSDNSQFGTGSLTFKGASADRSYYTAENTGVVCFTTGTLIRTARGEVPIEALRPGDRVETLDNGLQEVLWIGRRHLGKRKLAHAPHLLPVEIAPGLSGGTAPLVVSPQHGVVLRQDGEDILMRATHLARLDGGQARVMNGCRAVTYYHLMCARHEVIFANGAPSESFYPGPLALGALAAPIRAELGILFPEMLGRAPDSWYGESARPYSRMGALPEHLKALTPAA
ncbi:Hint domain-containing protein [Roseivivax sp.]